MNIVMTGGTGFIGSYIADRLLTEGHTLTLLARNPRKVAGFLDHPAVTIIKAELKDYGIVAEALKGQDACIHVALGWGDTAVDMLKNDTLPAVFLMEEAAKAGVKDFIYTSSTAAIGHFRPLMNSSLKTRPVDFYGATKASCENYLLALTAQTAMRGNIIRPGYTFGNPVTEGAPTQPDRRFADIVRCAQAGEPIRLIKHDGTQFIWAGDLAKIYNAVLKNRPNGKIYHGLSRNFTSWAEIAGEAIARLNSGSEILLEDKGWSSQPMLFELNEIYEDFGLEFDSTEELKRHVEFFCRG